MKSIAPLLHGLHGDRHLAVGGEEDGRHLAPARRDRLLQVETAHARHTEVGHQAAGAVDPDAQEFLGARRTCARRGPIDSINQRSEFRIEGSSSTIQTVGSGGIPCLAHR